MMVHWDRCERRFLQDRAYWHRMLGHMGEGSIIGIVRPTFGWEIQLAKTVMLLSHDLNRRQQEKGLTSHYQKSGDH